MPHLKNLLRPHLLLHADVLNALYLLLRSRTQNTQNTQNTLSLIFLAIMVFYKSTSNCKSWAFCSPWNQFKNTSGNEQCTIVLLKEFCYQKKKHSIFVLNHSAFIGVCSQRLYLHAELGKIIKWKNNWDFEFFNCCFYLSPVAWGLWFALSVSYAPPQPW